MNTIKLLIKLASFFPVQGYVRTANLQREPEACIVQELPLMHVKGDLNAGGKGYLRKVWSLYDRSESSPIKTSTFQIQFLSVRTIYQSRRFAPLLLRQKPILS